MGRGGHIPEEILLSPDNPRLAGYEPVSGQDDDRYTPYVHYTVQHNSICIAKPDFKNQRFFNCIVKIVLMY